MAKKAERIARRARIACEKWREYFNQNNLQYHEMHTFILGDQWLDDEREEMIKTFRKVPLMSNKLGTMSNTLIGEQQQNTPQLQVVPMTNCDEETAQLREIIVKDIVLSTDSNTVYQVAAGQAFIGGYSAFRWGTEYTHDKSFDLDIVPHYFKDATRTYFDVGAEKISKTDGMVAGYISRMTREKFRKTYGKNIEEKIFEESSITATESEIALVTQPDISNDPFNWADANAITILNHFERKISTQMLYKLSNGETYTQMELDEIIESSRRHIFEMQTFQQFQEGEIAGEDAALEEPIQSKVETALSGAQNAFDMADIDYMTLYIEGQPVRIEDKRESQKSTIKHYKIAGDYILEESDFPSEQLPIVFVDQNSYYDKNGKQICRSFFGDAKDTQKYINYLRTQSAYILKISRYDQYMGSKKNVASNDTAAKWRDPTAVQGLLTYDESPSGARPEPMRAPELSASLLTQYQLAIEDLYTCTGLYPTQMGQQGNEISGVAINARTRQGSYSTYVARNSINRAIATGGEIVNEMIPRVYDSERVISLMYPDEGQKNITINQQMDDYGEHIKNDIRKGTYQIRLMPGASYEGQKEQSLHSLKEVLQANPQMFNLVADLYAENLPLANTIELKNRLKTLVPPNILEAGKTGKPIQQNQTNPEQQQIAMQEKMNQMQMEMKAKEIELKQQEIMLKAEKQQAETEREIMRLETERLQVAAQLEEQKLRYLAETDRTQNDVAISHADNLTKILTHKVS